MGLDRGVLARVDRRLLAGLGQDETWRMVRIPTTPATWSTWKRACDAAGMSMGRAIAMLIGHELAGVIAEPVDGAGLSARLGEELVRREAQLAAREQELGRVEARLRAWEAELHRREQAVHAQQRRAATPAAPSIPPERSPGGVGRNEPCPCGSGRKYKHCHGSPAGQQRRASGTEGSRS